MGLPPASCPRQDENSCPRQDVIAHRRKADDRKSCYYQECDSLSADLATIATEDLGTGGYCRATPTRPANPQYSYCCNLEQYFTFLNETERPGIRFQRCDSMIT